MTIHYHGTPLTPRSELEKMAGKHMCVSFANPFDADWCQRYAQSVAWDNGAFVFFRGGILYVDWAKFYAWVEPRLFHPHWAVVPDVIGGSPEDNLALIRQWPFAKQTAAVVWHLNEPIEHLLLLVDMGFGKICFGSAGEYWQVGSEAWARRADEAFNALDQRGLLTITWVHMLRGLAVCGDRWPFASADSTNVARNFKNKGAEVDPERMALRIDAIQCHRPWVRVGKQEDMFA